MEVFAAAPFNHVITLNADGSRVAKTKHIPPTLSLQYHFLPQSSVRPYIGAGVNYTVFFDETTRGALEGTRLELRDSFGFAAEARLNGADLGTVQIDPYAYGLMLTRRLRF